MNTTTNNQLHRGLRARGGRLLAVGALALGSLGVAAACGDDDDDPFTNGTDDTTWDEGGDGTGMDGTDDTWDDGNGMDGTDDTWDDGNGMDDDGFGEDDPGEPLP